MIRSSDLAARGVEETRSRILAAARVLYAERGSRGTTTREVALRAGVNEATLFRHFGTKGHLLAAMLDHFSMEGPLPTVLEGLDRDMPLDEQLQELGRAAVETLRRKEDLIKISMAEEVMSPENEACAWRAPAAARERLDRYFARKVRSGELRGEPAWLSRIFMSMFYSYVIARKMWAGVGEGPEDDAIAVMVGVFLNGARAN